MKEINVLVVEDTQATIEEIRDAVELANEEWAEKEVTMVLETASTFEDAKRLLSSSDRKYDAAIVDIHLAEDAGSDPADPGSDMGGKRLVQLIFRDFQVPVFVYTGTPGHLDELKEHVSAFFKIYKKGEKAVEDILQEITDIHGGGILDMLGDAGVLNTFKKHFHDIFWKHLALSGEYWLAPERRDGLKRYVAQHMMEYLEQSASPAHGGFSDVYPAESYISPVVKKHVYTGDILKKQGGSLWIVLTPACDMALQIEKTNEKGEKYYIRKAEFILLAHLTPWKEMAGVTDKEGNLVTKYLTVLDKFNSPTFNRFSFLPKSLFMGACFIDFQRLESIPQDDVENSQKYKTIATVASPFLKDVVAKFSYYYSRQGAPSWEGRMADWI